MALDLNTGAEQSKNRNIDLLSKMNDSDLMGQLSDFIFPIVKNDWTLGNQVFASTLTMLGGLFVAYHVITGIVATAYTGKVLGQRWHQIWAPLRVILGFTLLTPIQSNGLSAVDQLPKLTFNMGNNLANAIAASAVNYQLSADNKIAPISIAGRDLAKQIAKAEACSFAYKMAWTRTAGASQDKEPPALPAPEPEVAFQPAQASWIPFKEGTPARIIGWRWDWGSACGSITFSAPTTDEFGDFAAERNKAASDMIKRIRKLDYLKGIEENFKQAGPSFTAKDIATKNIETWQAHGLLTVNLLQSLNNIGDIFNRAVSNSATKISHDENAAAKEKIREGINKYGWYMLGSVSRSLGRVHEKGYGYAGERPKIQKPNAQEWGSYESEIETVLALIDTQMLSEAHDLAKLGEAMAELDTDGAILADIIGYFTTPMHEYLTGYQGFRADPIGDMSNLGHRLLIGAESGFTAGVAATSVASLLSAVSQTPQKVVEFVMKPGWLVIGAMFIGGGVLALVLPNIPYIFFTFTAVVIAMELLAFVIAGKLWAFQHIRMDGEEFVNSHQSIGYQLLFSTFLRQPITVLSFLGTSHATVWAQNLLLKTWSITYVGSIGSQTLSFTALLFGFVVMIYLQWHIQLRMYGLMLEMPQRVASVMGHHIAGWGDTGHGDAAIAGGVALIAAHSRMPSAAGSGAIKSASKQSDNKDNNGGGSR